MKLKARETYHFDLRGQLRFGQLPESVLISVFSDGRASNGLLTAYILDQFEELTEAKTDQKGFDYRHPVYGRIEQKQITPGGKLCFAQSGMTGMGRKVDRDTLFDFVNDLDIHFLIVSTVNFPRVSLTLVPGRDLFKEFPNKSCSVAASKALQFLNLPPAG